MNQSFCWKCGKRLMRAAIGKHRGELVYEEIHFDDAVHRVHKRCKDWNESFAERRKAQRDVEKALRSF